MKRALIVCCLMAACGPSTERHERPIHVRIDVTDERKLEKVRGDLEKALRDLYRTLKRACLSSHASQVKTTSKPRQIDLPRHLPGAVLWPIAGAGDLVMYCDNGIGDGITCVSKYRRKLHWFDKPYRDRLVDFVVHGTCLDDGNVRHRFTEKVRQLIQGHAGDSDPTSFTPRWIGERIGKRCVHVWFTLVDHVHEVMESGR